jgi:hypothetical protein
LDSQTSEVSFLFWFTTYGQTERKDALGTPRQPSDGPHAEGFLAHGGSLPKGAAMIEISANGASITPMMGVQVLRRARGIAYLAMKEEQVQEIKKLTPLALMTFLGKDIHIDAGVPEKEIHFRDDKNAIVAKITNLGRSRAIPIEELKRG